jgi:hypothetical protein
METTGKIPTAKDLYAILIKLLEDQESVKIDYEVIETKKEVTKNEVA